MSKDLSLKDAFLPLLLFWCGHFLIDFMIGIWPVYKTLAGMDLRVAGVMTAVAVAFGEGSQLFFGPFGDYGYKRSILIFAFIASIAPAFYAFFGQNLIIL